MRIVSFIFIIMLWSLQICSSSIKIAIISVHDVSMEHIYQWSDINKRNYAQKYGYDFIVYNDTLDAERPISWSKILAIKKHLAAYDWIFWSNAESLIMDDCRSLEDFIDEEYDMILTRDGVSDTNLDNFFLKNSPWSFRLLDLIYNQKVFIHCGWHEQSALNYLYVDRATYIRRRIKFLPQKAFNAFCSDNEFGCKYESGDFIINCAGVNKKLDKIRDAFMQVSKKDTDTTINGVSQKPTFYSRKI